MLESIPQPRLFECSPNGERALAVFDNRLVWLNLGVLPLQARQLDGTFSAWSHLQVFDDGSAVMLDPLFNAGRVHAPGNNPVTDPLTGVTDKVRVRILDASKKHVAIEWVEPKQNILKQLFSKERYRANLRLKQTGKHEIQLGKTSMTAFETGHISASFSPNGKLLAGALKLENDWNMFVYDVEAANVVFEVHIDEPVRAVDDEGRVLTGMKVVRGSAVEPLEGEYWGHNRGWVYTKDGQRVQWSKSWQARPCVPVSNIVHAFLVSGHEEAFMYLDRPVEFATSGQRRTFFSWHLENERVADYERQLKDFVTHHPPGAWIHNGQRFYEILRNPQGWWMRALDEAPTLPPLREANTEKVLD